MGEKKRILTEEQVQQKIKRMAFQVLERNFDEPELVFVGIDGGGSGYLLAEALVKHFSTISEKPCVLIKANFEKQQADLNLQFDKSLDTLKNKAVVIIDDVLNTGKTIIRTMVAVYAHQPKSIQVGTMVNRAFLAFPIKADFVGYSLSTTLNNSVLVAMNQPDENGVFLL